MKYFNNIPVVLIAMLTCVVEDVLFDISKCEQVILSPVV